MAKNRFRYNEATCRYEPFYVKGKVLRNRIFVFLALSVALAAVSYVYILKYIPSLDEMFLADEHQRLRIEWDILHDRIGETNEKLAALIEKGDHNYRVILDSEPLGASIREAGIGGSEKINTAQLGEFPLVLKEYIILEKLKHQLDVELQSYDEIARMFEQKSIMWAARPAIQPVSNKTLTHLHTTFGERFHPLLGYVRDHKGLDFTADVGTPVYATGDGVVKTAYFSLSFGNAIFIDHGYGYETRYAHLSAFNARKGQKIKRGEIIGFVGNTGLSHGAHLHYEVLFNGQQINPINFFQRDLSNKEYEKLVEEGSKQRESLD
ncbi:MAG TPA: M23 family metallopeptidase [Chryseosolibacter sp.]|nr:M23 family metallopeptidase [Chryseosolibacter sp.]